MIGVLAGGSLAAVAGADTRLVFALAIACVFGMFFTAPLSYALMSFFVTTMIGLLYTLLGTFSRDVLVLRVEETLIGAACGFLAATVVLPVKVDRHTDERLCTVLDRLRGTLSAALSQLREDTEQPNRSSAGPIHAARELDTALDQLRASMEPILHPANPLRPRRYRALYLTRLLDTCAYHARALAAVAETSSARPRLDDEIRDALAANAQAVMHDTSVLCARVCKGSNTEPGPWRDAPAPPPRSLSLPTSPPSSSSMTAAVRALRHLHRIAEAQTALAQLLGVRPPPPVDEDPPPAREHPGLDALDAAARW